MIGSASARLEVDLEGQCSRVGHDAAKQIAYGSEVVLAVGEHGLGQREPTELVVVRGSDGVIVGNGKIWRSSRLDHCHWCVPCRESSRSVELGNGHAALANEQMRDLTCRRIQCDEFGRSKDLRPRKSHCQVRKSQVAGHYRCALSLVFKLSWLLIGRQLFIPH